MPKPFGVSNTARGAGSGAELGAGGASQGAAQHGTEHATALEMAEPPARDQGGIASAELDKENTPDNVSNAKRARTQQILHHLKKAAAAAKCNFNPTLDRTPDDMISHEAPHPRAAGGGHCADWDDRVRGNEVDEAAVAAELAAKHAELEAAAAAEEADTDAEGFADVSSPAGGETEVEGSDGEEEEVPPRTAESPQPQSPQSQQPSQAEEAAPMGEDGLLDMDLSRRPAHPLAGHPTFRSHMPSVKRNTEHQDDEGNPKTLFEAAHVVMETRGHRFVVLDDDVKPTMLVCDEATNTWSSKPSAISNFIKEACDGMYYFKGSATDEERKKKYVVSSPTHRATVLAELMVFNTIDPRAWSEMIDRVAPGNVACADGFWDVEEMSCRPYTPSDFMTSNGVDNAFQMPFVPKKDDGDIEWNLSRSEAADLYADLQARMQEIMPDEVMRVTVLGYMGGALLHYGKPRKFLVLTGAGSNGKSALLELFGMVLGKAVKTFGGSTDCPFLANSRSDVRASNSPAVACKGKLIVATLDCPDDRDIDAGLLKNVTGDVSIDARELYKTNETIRTDFLTIFASNHTLRFTVLDKAVADRIVAYQMPSRFVLKESATDDEADKVEATQLALKDDSLANPLHYFAEPGWQEKYKTPIGKLVLYGFVMQMYKEFKDMAETSTSPYDVSQQYKDRAAIAPEVAAFTTPTTKSVRISKEEVAADFAKAMDKIIFVTSIDTNTVSYKAIYNELEVLGVTEHVRGKAARCLGKNLIPWAEATDGVEVATGLVKGKKVLRGVKLKRECPTFAPPPGYIDSPTPSFCGSPPTTPVRA